MSKCLKLRHIFMVLFIFELYACGNTFPIQRNEKPDERLSIAKNMVLCEQGQSTKYQNLFNDFYLLDGQVNKLVADYKRSFPDRVLMLNSTQINEQDLSPEHPLALSFDDLSTHLSQLKNRLSQILTTESFTSLLSVKKVAFYFDFVKSVDKETIEKILIDLRRHAGFAARFQNYQCKLNQLAMNSDSDVRTYLKLKKSLCGDFQHDSCLEQKLKNYKLLARKEQKDIHKDFIKLCNAIERKPVCESLFYEFKSKNKLNNLMTNYLSIFKNRKYDSLFKTRKNGQKFSCRKEKEKIIMTLPLNYDPKDNREFLGGFIMANNFVENMWTNHKFKLEIKPVKENSKQTFKLIFKPGIISHVNIHKTKTIALNSKLNKFSLFKTFAHEIGHVLGFNDCYIEYFDHQTGQIIYYELGHSDRNLMCSIGFGSQIPASYFEQLIENVCQF
jgi:hypothetical protein